MKQVLTFVFGLVVAALLLGVFVVDVPLATVAAVAAGAVCLGWLVVIVVLPWNLFFQARQLLLEIDRSRQRGLAVDGATEARARTVATRMLRISVALHLLSAALLAGGAWLYDEDVGFVFAGLFLLSTLFRPGVEYYRHVRRLLSQALQEISYPRDDVVKLVDDVHSVVARLDAVHASITSLRSEQQRTDHEASSQNAENRRRIDGIARKFEETIDRLTDNQEIISGIKAFLRLVQTPGLAPPPR